MPFLRGMDVPEVLGGEHAGVNLPRPPGSGSDRGAGQERFVIGLMVDIGRVSMVGGPHLEHLAALRGRVRTRSIYATAHLSRCISRNSLVVSPKLPSRKSQRRKRVAREVYDTPIQPKLVDSPPHHQRGE